MENNNGTFYLPDLPYEANALEPYISEETIRVHHFMLHKKYVDQLNEIMKNNPGYHEYGLVELIQNVDKLPAGIRTGVLRNAGGVLNHDYYFDMMRPAPNDKPNGLLGEAIDKQFGTFDNFKKDFTTAAMTVFGSGWTWLTADETGKLYLLNTENQVTPYSFKRIPIITIDIWEHSFFQQYPAKRADYIEAWYNVADWKKADALYSAILNP